MKVLDLFSGIGGFSLGLERAGMETAAFCEIDPFCHKVLRKHWPDVPIFTDIKNFNAKDLIFYGIKGIKLVCGGFPCQDVSGCKPEGHGIAGKQSSLWAEYARIINEIQPKYAIIENVPLLRNRGLCKVLSDLHTIGYDAEWHIISAADFGAAHLRERLWVVAYPTGIRRFDTVISAKRFKNFRDSARQTREKGVIPFDPVRRPYQKIPERVLLADGVSSWVDKHLKCYGNALFPKTAEFIGREILKDEQSRLFYGIQSIY